MLVVEDPDPSAPVEKDTDKKDSEPKTPKPIVINRYYFKADVSGYLRGERSHLQLFDIAAKKAEPLTPGTFDEESPAWSPDGTQVAFIRRHGDGDVDKAPNHDVFVIEARAGAKERRLTTTTADEGGRPAWSPDGRSIAYLLGDELKYSAYDQNRLAVMPAAGGQARILTEALDRPVRAPFWTAGWLDPVQRVRRPLGAHREDSGVRRQDREARHRPARDHELLSPAPTAAWP